MIPDDVMLEGRRENCLYKQEVSVIYTVMCCNLLGHTADLFFMMGDNLASTLTGKWPL